MARPTSKTILSITDDDNIKYEILEVESLYAVVYQDKVFSMRNTYPSLTYTGTKYPKYVYPTKKVAENLAQKLNNLFASTDFKVIKLI
jgi:hypothetical protein